MDWRFVAAESAKGMRRHLPMTVALVVCVAVSLTLVGVSWLLARQVDQLKGYWYDKVEVSVFLCGQASDPQVCPAGAASPAQRREVRDRLEGLAVTEQVYYESQREAWRRFSDRYAGARVLREVDASTMPESFRVKLRDPTRFAVVADAVADHPAVESVQDQRRLLAGFFRLVGGLQLAALAVAVSQVLVAALMVGATVRLAVHARRTEVAVMRLVGASRAMIRAPFFGEAALAGLAGSVLAVGLLAAAQHYVVDTVLASQTSTARYVSWVDVAQIAPALLAGGMLLPAAAAAVSLRRHLRR